MLDAATLPRLLPDVAIVFDARHARLVAACVDRVAREDNRSPRITWLTLLCGDWCVWEDDDLQGEFRVPIRLLPALALSTRPNAA